MDAFTAEQLGSEKKPKKKSIGRMGDVQSVANQIPGNLVEILFSLLKLFTVVKGSNLGVGGRWRRGPYR